MLFHRVAAFGRALLLAGGLALSALGSATQVLRAHTPAPHQTASLTLPTIQAHNELPTDRLKKGEQVELVSVELRSVVRAPVTNAADSIRRTPPNGVVANALRWCDLIQCRRLGGAMLLGFATPPPAQR